MKLLKIFGLFLLLLSGNPGSAGTFILDLDFSDENSITAEVSEDIQQQFQSTLTTPPVIDTNIFSGDAKHLNFIFRSHFKTEEAEIYINWSRSIDPSLGIPEIIFPFHSFL